MMDCLSNVNVSVLSHPAVPVAKVVTLFLTPAAQQCHLGMVIMLSAVLNELPGPHLDGFNQNDGG